MRRGDLPAARDAFKKAVKLNPRNADAQNMLGQVLLQEGDITMPSFISAPWSAYARLYQ